MAEGEKVKVDLVHCNLHLASQPVLTANLRPIFERVGMTVDIDMTSPVKLAGDMTDDEIALWRESGMYWPVNYTLRRVREMLAKGISDPERHHYVMVSRPIHDMLKGTVPTVPRVQSIGDKGSIVNLTVAGFREVLRHRGVEITSDLFRSLRGAIVTSGIRGLK